MKKAIIVDDESLCIDLVVSLIERYNIPIDVVDTANSGLSAFEKIKRHHPDIVYLDIEMPDMTGIELIKKVNKEIGNHISFIVITAYDSFEYAQAVLRLGAKDILLKPVKYSQFIETMERVLGYRYTSNLTFNEILEYIHRHFQDDIDLKDCADKFHISKSHISRMFKKYMNIGFTTYKNRLKVQKAKELLKDTDLSIKEVSDEAGFTNLNYFYRVFRNETGITPKDFKENE